MVIYNLFKVYYPLKKKKERERPKVSYSRTEFTEIMQPFRRGICCKHSYRSHQWSAEVPVDSLLLRLGTRSTWLLALHCFFPFLYQYKSRTTKKSHVKALISTVPK